MVPELHWASVLASLYYRVQLAGHSEEVKRGLIKELDSVTLYNRFKKKNHVIVADERPHF